MKPLVVVFDNSPLGAAPWMTKTAQALGLHFVDQESLGKVLAESETLQQAILSPQVKRFANPHQHPGLSTYYQAALKKLAPDKERIALHGWGWLVFAERVHACVLDFSGFEAERKALEKNRSLKPAQIAENLEKAKAIVRDQAKQRVYPDSVLELPMGASDADKEAKAMAFLRPLG